MLKEFTRQLEQDEKAFLEHEKSVLQKRNSFQKWFMILSAPILLGLIIYLATSFWAQQDMYIINIALVIFILYITFIAWQFLQNMQVNQENIEALTFALDNNEVHILHLSINKMVRVEPLEIKDEGLFFQIEDTKMIYLEGALFSENEKFPNTDFEYIRIYDQTKENLVIQDISTHGIKLKASRTISQSTKQDLIISGNYPNHTAIIDGTLEDIEEQILAS